MSEDPTVAKSATVQTIRCNWRSKLRKPSAYAGDFEFPGLVDICQWCRGVETRNARGKAKPEPGEWVDRVYPLQFAGKPLRDGEEEAE